MATKTAVPTLTVSGNLSRCELKRRHVPDYGHYRRFTFDAERYDFYLNCTLQTDDGQTIIFKTPPSRMHVRKLGRGKTEATFKESKWKGTYPADQPWYALAEQGSTKELRSKVQLGERVTIEGRVKAEEVSKAGKPYTVLYVVKRVI